MRKIIVLLIYALVLLSITINCTNKKINLPKTKEALIKEINNEYKDFLFLKSEYVKFKQIESCLTRNLLFQRQAMLILKEESKKIRIKSAIASGLLSSASSKSTASLKQRDNISIKKMRIYNKLTYSILNYNNLVKKVSHQELTLNGLPSFISSIDLEESFY